MNYKLIQEILKATEDASDRNEAGVQEDDFVFQCERYKNNLFLREELKELELKGFIRDIGNGVFVPTYKAYHYKRCIFLSLLKYIGRSVLTPIAVTLITLWISSLLQENA